MNRPRKLPYITFYPRDWLADSALRVCGYAARGLWADMLCIMAQADRRGFLEVQGQPMTPDLLARLTSGDPAEVKALLAELETAGVFSRDDGGAIYSRRMVKDTETIRRNTANGQRGGNPSLLPDNPPRITDGDAPPDRPIPTPTPTTREDREGENMRARARMKSGPPDGKLAPAFKALSATGKFPTLTYEHLMLVNRNYPRADMAANFPELVTTAQGIPGTINDPVAWLNKKASQIEVRLTRPAGHGDRKPVVANYGDPNDPLTGQKGKTP